MHSIPQLSRLGFRYVHIVTFVWCFSYLLFFRTTNLFSIRLPVAHSNAIQLMLTLKVCWEEDSNE